MHADPEVIGSITPDISPASQATSDLDRYARVVQTSWPRSELGARDFGRPNFLGQYVGPSSCRAWPRTSALPRPIPEIGMAACETAWGTRLCDPRAAPRQHSLMHMWAASVWVESLRPTPQPDILPIAGRDGSTRSCSSFRRGGDPDARTSPRALDEVIDYPSHSLWVAVRLRSRRLCYAATIGPPPGPPEAPHESL
jgi:hypothetical protein